MSDASSTDHVELLNRCRDERLIDAFEARGEVVRIRNAGLEHDLTPDQAFRFASALLRHAPTFARLRHSAVPRDAEEGR